MTAGELAEHTGLTTGAITGVIDRLEKTGFVKRDRDPDDRRKVVIVPDQQKAQKVFGPVFGRLIDQMTVLYDQFSPEELDTICSYMEKTTVLIKELVQELGSNNKK
ncbi:transcriptional regulatory protein [Fulvivirga imtechensis AK7]|uniref:Transcriptional regulatory protein n=2 Tax=Fulvivirga TaxID=396811 RepID=L8JV36_9BACT|nr:transcriptional regulatory protein [Fulvivirga imtechensis AK7]